MDEQSKPTNLKINKLTSFVLFTSFVHQNLTHLFFFKLDLIQFFVNRKCAVAHLSALTIDQSFSDLEFKQFIDYLALNRKIKLVTLNKSLIDGDQTRTLELFVSGVRKDLTIKDVNGGKFGPAFVDWTYYNESTKTSFLKGLRETTSYAYDFLKSENCALPLVGDFGCGTGRDSIPLAMRNCQIFSIDSEKFALKILAKNILKYLPAEKRKSITIINDSVQDLHDCIKKKSLDILVCSYTFPYRPKKIFETCFAKWLSFLKPGGFLAAQFFGTFDNSSESMTYHSKADLKVLFSRHGLELIHLKTEKQGDVAIFGGEENFCGDLYHVVARKTLNWD